jgi:endonuclease YncB( thermonuclease family)
VGLLLLAGLAAASGLAGSWRRAGAGAGAPVATGPAGAWSGLGDDVVRGRVTLVRDGDTVEVRSGDREIRVRVYGIDTPERGQPWSTKAKRFTADLVGNREVVLRVRAKDKYDRTVAEVLLPDGRNLSEEILRAGLAWHYDFHSRNAEWHRLMEEARAAGRGLWSDEKRCEGRADCPTRPVSPRDFRVEERRAGRGPHSAPPPGGARSDAGGRAGR